MRRIASPAVLFPSLSSPSRPSGSAVPEQRSPLCRKTPGNGTCPEACACQSMPRFRQPSSAGRKASRTGASPPDPEPAGRKRRLSAAQWMIPLSGIIPVFFFSLRCERKSTALPAALPVKRAQKNRGAGHGAPGNDSVHWSALSFPGFQTFKQKLFHVHRAFYLEILLCRLCSFTSPAHQLGANDVTTLGYPSLGF